MQSAIQKLTNEQAELIKQAVREAIAELYERASSPKPEPTVEEVKAKIKEDARKAAIETGRAAVDCAKIAGRGLLEAWDSLFTAGVAIAMRLNGRQPR